MLTVWRLRLCWPSFAVGMVREPEPDNLLSMLALSSDVMVSVATSVPAPAPVARRTAPLLSPVEALSALECAVAASFALDAEHTLADTATSRKTSEPINLPSCIEELSQAIAGFTGHGSVGARLPRSAVVLGKAQSRLRALRKEAVAREASAELRAGASAIPLCRISSDLNDLRKSDSFTDSHVLKTRCLRHPLIRS
jgi:hypothetical protein